MTEKRFTIDEIMEIIDNSFYYYYLRFKHNMSRSEYLFFENIEDTIKKKVLNELLELEKELKE